MPTAKPSVADIVGGDGGAGMQGDNNKRAVTRTIVLLVMLAVGIYIAFIMLSILK